MTELLRLIEFNEIKNIRVTCLRCDFAVRVPVKDLNHAMACPNCGKEYDAVFDSLLDFKSALQKRAADKNFTVQVELFENQL